MSLVDDKLPILSCMFCFYTQSTLIWGFLFSCSICHEFLTVLFFNFFNYRSCYLRCQAILVRIVFIFVVIISFWSILRTKVDMFENTLYAHSTIPKLASNVHNWYLPSRYSSSTFLANISNEYPVRTTTALSKERNA